MNAAPGDTSPDRPIGARALSTLGIIAGIVAISQFRAWVAIGIVAAAVTEELGSRFARERWLGARTRSALVVLAVGLVTGGAAVAIGALTRGPTTYSVQDVLDRARASGYRPATAAGVRNPLVARLRPDDTDTAVFVFQPRAAEDEASDRLEVFDVQHDGRLRQRLTFQPAPGPDQAGGVLRSALAELPERLGTDGLRMALHGRPRDLDGLAGDDLLLDLRENGFGEPLWPRPILLNWDGVAAEYSLTPLLSTSSVARGATPDELLSRRFMSGPGDIAGYVLSRVYAQALPVVDEESGVDYSAAYASETYVCSRERVRSTRGPSMTGLVIDAGYVVRSPSIATPEVLQVVRWHVRWEDGALQAIPEKHAPRFVRVGRNVSRLAQLVARASATGPPCSG